MTAHVVRRKPWGKGKKNAPEQKKTKTGRVELINENENENENGTEEGVLQ